MWLPSRHRRTHWLSSCSYIRRCLVCLPIGNPTNRSDWHNLEPSINVLWMSSSKCYPHGKPNKNDIGNTTSRLRVSSRNKSWPNDEYLRLSNRYILEQWDKDLQLIELTWILIQEPLAFLNTNETVLMVHSTRRFGVVRKCTMADWLVVGEVSFIAVELCYQCREGAFTIDQNWTGWESNFGTNHHRRLLNCT